LGDPEVHIDTEAVEKVILDNCILVLEPLFCGFPLFLEVVWVVGFCLYQCHRPH